MYECVFVCVCVCVYTLVWRPEVDVGYRPWLLSTLFLTCLLTEARAHWLARVAVHQAPGSSWFCPTLPVPGLQTCAQAHILCGCLESKLGSSGLFSRYFLTEPSPQLPLSLLNLKASQGQRCFYPHFTDTDNEKGERWLVKGYIHSQCVYVVKLRSLPWYILA